MLGTRPSSCQAPSCALPRSKCLLLFKGLDLLRDSELLQTTLNAQGLAGPEAVVRHMVEGNWVGDAADDSGGKASPGLSQQPLPLLTSNLALGEDNSASLTARALYHKNQHCLRAW